VFDEAAPVLGIDPGLTRCGYGALRRVDDRMAVVACGVLRTEPGDPLPERLAALGAELDGLIAELAPSSVAVERLLFQANVRTAVAVGQASGLALAVAGRAGVPVVHYSPNAVKLAVAGHGAAPKAQVQAMVTRLLGLSAAPPADAADALALAICHAWTAPLREAADEATAGEAGAGDRLDRAVAAALARDDAAGVST
jgi:crossover junction endodeoxyribonuclease RuvC